MTSDIRQQLEYISLTHLAALGGSNEDLAPRPSSNIPRLVHLFDLGR